MGFGSFFIAVSVAFLAAATLLKNDDFSPTDYRLPPPPKLIGALGVRPIKGAEKLFEGRFLGPESLVLEKDVIYTCTQDGRCVKINAANGKVLKEVRLTKHTGCDGSAKSLYYCGRPLGLRRWNTDQFIVADATLGIYSINFEAGTHEQIFSAQASVVDGKRVMFPDDFDFIDPDTIIFSDATTKRGFPQFMLSLLEHAGDGRVLQLKLSTGEVSSLVEGLEFANGVQVHPDKKSVLIAETGAARIQRYYFAGPKRGHREIFADNLPGLPDNVRLSSSGKTFYVALPTLRTNDLPSFYDHFAPRPLVRKLFGEISTWLPEPLVHRAYGLVSPNQYGILVELDIGGNIIDSYHDTTGEVIKDISQVADDGGKYLYLGSFSNPYIARVLKH